MLIGLYMGPWIQTRAGCMQSKHLNLSLAPSVNTFLGNEVGTKEQFKWLKTAQETGHRKFMFCGIV